MELLCQSSYVSYVVVRGIIVVSHFSLEFTKQLGRGKPRSSAVPFSSGHPTPIGNHHEEVDFRG